MDKIIAKVIYYGTMIITILVTIVLIATLGAMVEAWTISKAHSVIVIACAVWLAMYAIFIYLLER